MTTRNQLISLTNLSVNIENPRFELVGNQREAIQVMIADQSEKLLHLAKDIVDVGMLNPGELIYVTPHSIDKGKFSVLEGNRRITTLKILSNPDLIDAEYSSFLKRLKPLAEQFRKKPILDIACVVFDNPDDANKWIKLRHTGENDGVGIVRWDAQQVARFDERIEGTSAVAIQAIDFLRNSDAVSSELKGKLKKVPSTSLNRLLTDKQVQQVIGISIKDNRLQTNLQKEEVLKGLVKIVTDLVEKKINVKTIYTKDDRAKYLESFEPSEIPNKKKKSSASWELISPDQSSKAEKPKKKAKAAPISTDRENVIPKECVILINENRINTIYKELKNLDVEKFSNAGAIMLRVFIEMSVDTFIEHHQVQNLNQNDKLRKKVQDVSAYMESQGLAKKQEFKGIRNAVSNNDSVYSIETFNAYVHNRFYSPTPKELKITWDNIETFVQKIWDTIK